LGKRKLPIQLNPECTMPISRKKQASLLGATIEVKKRKTSANPVGRPTGRDPEHTRGAILDTAEALFSELGYEGTSIRDIATGCNIQAAVVGYHYGSKVELFNAVVGRRAVIINDARRWALDAQLSVRKKEPLAVDVLIHMYVAPLLEATSHGDPGWRNFASLMGRLANSPRGTEMINQHYSEVASLYMSEFKRSLPSVPEGRLIDGFLYMVSAMLFVCADTGRWEAMAQRAQDTHRDSQVILDDLVPFVAGGFKALLQNK
jgi:AcrR family transcriptional regulator